MSVRWSVGVTLGASLEGTPGVTFDGSFGEHPVDTLSADVLVLAELAVDASWLAELLECGLLAGSFIPAAEAKAVRDVVRYRRKIVQARSSETQRLGGVRQDAGIKLDSVASSIDTVSGLAMIRALIDGERRGQVLAELARGTMRRKITDLSRALEGPLR